MNENMKAFQNDLKANRPAEYLSAELLRLVFPKMTVEFVGEDKKYWHKGDLKLIKPDGSSRCIDVKNDKRCGESGNLNAEDELWKESYQYYGSGYAKGFMRTAKYNYVMYLNLENKEFFIISFKKWKSVYNKKGYYTTSVGKPSSYDDKGRKVMKHPFNSRNPYEITYGYLNPIKKMIEAGVVLYKVKFDYDGSIDDYENLHIVEKIDYSKKAA